MKKLIVKKPAPGEYAPYLGKYIDVFAEKNVIDVLMEQKEKASALLRSIPKEKEDYRYAEGKWSIKEVLGHVLDSERISVYRMLFIAHEENVTLPSYNQEKWVSGCEYDSVSLLELVREFELLREANYILLSRIKADEWLKRGTSNNNEISVRALAYLMAGHAEHHFNVIREKYLNN